MDSGIAQRGDHLYPLASILLNLANLCHLDGLRVERQPIGRNISNTNILEELRESLRRTVTVSEQVDISGWTVQSVCPEGEEERTLEDELIGAFRVAQAVQQAFSAIPSQSEIEILATVSAQIQQPLANGSWEIGGLFFVHAVASMYGLMTFATRHILAKCQSSSLVHLLCLRQSRSASSAISSPILFRYLKQSATVLAGL
jgi:hypothetical protein